MSIAIKYRPQTLVELVGQNHITQTLSNAVVREKLAQAYLFCGPRGVGKTSAARILAKMLNCQKGPTPTPCNECTSCKEIVASNSIDVIEIDGASHTGVDDVREIINNCQYFPNRLRYKIYIIDEIHMLSNSAFNALLKTLEEPPKHVVFIFATTDPQKIPATVLSRCQRFDFRKIPIPVIVTNLKKVLQSEGVVIDLDALRNIAEISEGSLRDAQTLCEQAIAFCGKNELSSAEINQMLGLIDRRLLMDLARSLCEKRTSGALQILREIDEGGYDLKRTLVRLIQTFRNCLILKTCPGETVLVEDDVDDIENVRKMIEPLAYEEIDRTLTLLIENLRRLAQSETPYILCQAYLVKICEMPPLQAIDQLITRLSSVVRLHSQLSDRQVSESPGTTVVARSPTGIASSPPSPVSPIRSASSAEPSEGAKDWDGFVQFVKTKKPGFAALLCHVRPHRTENQVFYIDVEKDGFYYQTLSDAPNSKLFEAFLAEYFGAPFKMRFTSAGRPKSDAPGQNASAPQGSLITEKKRELLESPVVKESARLFGGHIEEVKVYGVKTESQHAAKTSNNSGGGQNHV